MEIFEDLFSGAIGFGMVWIMLQVIRFFEGLGMYYAVGFALVGLLAYQAWSNTRA